MGKVGTCKTYSRAETTEAQSYLQQGASVTEPLEEPTNPVPQGATEPFEEPT